MLPEQGVVRALRQWRQGAALVYTGPAGVGKTHAAHALLTRLGVPVHVFPATLPLSDWPARLPAPRALPAWAAAALRRLPDGDGAPAALTALLVALAPVGVLVDDLHDAPGLQTEALLRLAGSVDRARGVTLLLTSRQAAPAGLPACPVEPLPEDGTLALTHHELGPDVPPEAVAWVHARAQGNPLFTLEFLRYRGRDAA